MASYFDPQSNRWRDSDTGTYVAGGGGGGRSGAVFDANPLRQAVASASSAVLGAGTFFARTFLNLAGMVGRALLTGVGLILGGATALSGALLAAGKISVDAANRWARSLATIRANTGMGFTQGFGLASRNSLFGIGPEETAGMLQNPLLARLRGLNYNDPNLLSGLAGQYQALANRGPLGRMLANNRLDAQFGGQAPESVRLLANLPQNKIQEQLGYGARMQTAFGINPELLRRYAEDVPLSVNRIGFAFEQMKILFAVKVLPIIERGLGTVAQLLANNADKIVSGIETVANFLVQDFPPMLMRFGAGVAGGLAGFLEGLGTFLTGLGEKVPTILTVLDTLLNGLRQFGAVAAGIAAMVAQGASNIASSPLAKSLGRVMESNPGVTAGVAVGGLAVGGLAARALGGGMLGRIGAAAGRALMTPAGLIGAGGLALGVAGYEGLRALGIGPWKNLPSSAQIASYYLGGGAPSGAPSDAPSGGPLGPYLPQPGRSIGDAYHQAHAAFLSQVGVSNLAGDSNVTQMLANLANTGAQRAGNAASVLRELQQKLESGAAGWDAEMAKAIKDIAANTRQTAQNTEQGARSGRDLLDGMPGFLREMGARTSANIVEDVALGLMR